MRTAALALAMVTVMALAGCATQPATPARERAAAVPFNDCRPPQGGVPRADYCGYPADVRAFLDDRDLCDHFRGEPWPEGDSKADKVRRKQIVDGVRSACAGTDRQLAELLIRYQGDAAITQLLSQFERDIESGAP